jgi:serine/threonine-protein kinase
MHSSRLGLVGLILAGCTSLWNVSTVSGQEGGSASFKEKLPPNVAAIFEKHCFQCHGKDAKPKGKFKVFDQDHLKSKVAKDSPDAVPELWQRLTAKPDDGLMPPEDAGALTKAELDAVEAWLKDGAKPFGEQRTVTATQEKPAAPAVAGDEARQLANAAKEVLRQHCYQCHGESNPKGGVRILDYDSLVSKKKKVIPGKLFESDIFSLMTANDQSVMPPAEKPRVESDKLVAVMKWIAAGAPKWDEDTSLAGGEDPFFANKNVVGVDYVLNKILNDARDIPPQERRFMRYISFNHLLVRGTTDGELATNSKALATALNHLSFQQELVRPRPIDGPRAQRFGVQNQGGTRTEPRPGEPKEATIYCIDLRKFGWDIQCFDAYGTGGRKLNGSQYQERMNLYDLCLLEYPYSTIYHQAQAYRDVYDTYIRYTGMVRPIPFVRGDWFCSVCLSSPLYEDMLQFPRFLYELENRLGVRAEENLMNDVARRAGMTVSGVSRNNRIVERHPATFGYYWKSLDFQTSKGGENMFRDPLYPEFVGGEMIFSLPNHMQGYLVTDHLGNRILEAPTSIVTDKFASDKVVRNGLACIRCHDQGVKPFQDTVRAAFDKKQQALLPFVGNQVYNKVLSIYPEQEEMQKLYIDPDTQRFRKAYEGLNGEAPPTLNPLTPVSQKFLDEPLNIANASAELGIRKAGALQNVLMTEEFAALGVLPLATGGDLRRDAWEDYFDQVTTGLGLGVPVVNIDALSRKDYVSRKDGLGLKSVELATIDAATSKPRKTFKPGDKMRLKITNKSKYDIYCEMIFTDKHGSKVIAMPCTTIIPKNGGTMFFPPMASDPIVCDAETGKEEVTLYYCDKPFPPARICRLAEHERAPYIVSDYVAKAYELKPGHQGYQKWVFDRAVHPFYLDYASGQYYPTFNPSQMCKRTFTLGTE